MKGFLCIAIAESSKDALKYSAHKFLSFVRVILVRIVISFMEYNFCVGVGAPYSVHIYCLKDAHTCLRVVAVKTFIGDMLRLEQIVKYCSSFPSFDPLVQKCLGTSCFALLVLARL